MSETDNQRHDVLDEVLRLGAGFKDGERPWVLEALSAPPRSSAASAEAPIPRRGEQDRGVDRLRR